MKLALLALALVAFPLNSFAGRASPLKGWYEILSTQNAVQDAAPAPSPTPAPAPAPQKQYFMIDDDSLSNIWSRWASGDLPADLASLKDEDTILAAFTNRDTVFLSLEKTATIANNYLSIHDGDKQMELRKNADNTTDLAVVEAGKVVFYKLGPASQNPGEMHIDLKSALH